MPSQRRTCYGLLVVFMVVGLVAIFLMTHHKLLEILCKPISTILFAVWLGGFVWLIIVVAKRYRRVYKFKWYDLSKRGPNEEMEWNQIKCLIKKNPRKYACKNECACKQRYKLWPDRYPCKYFVFDICVLLILAILAFGSFRLIIGQSSGSNSEGLKSLGILFGGLSLIAGVFSIFYQGRLKSRSENRQAWINSIRKDMNFLITNIPPHDAPLHRVQRIREEIGECLVNLELSLNPSERVHRGFMAIICFMYRIDDCLNKEARKGLGIDDCLNEEARRKPGMCKEPSTKEKEEKDWKKWRTRAIRLAAVLLKREWEQVKHVK